MAVTAPLRVPVEIRRQGAGARGVGAGGASTIGDRWFRLAHGVSERGLSFGRALPEECDGPLAIRFTLPDDAGGAIELSARAVSLDTGQDAPPTERLAVRFLAPDEPSRARIALYVAARVPASD